MYRERCQNEYMFDYNIWFYLQNLKTKKYIQDKKKKK